MSGLRWHLVVLDDRREFAVHVWRYLNRSIGIGVNPIEDSGRGWIPGDKPTPFIDGAHRFSWISADSDWRDSLEALLAEVDTSWGFLFVIDMVGKNNSAYAPDAVRLWVEAWSQYHGTKVDMRFVSAYNINARLHGNVEVLPKSRSTLSKIRHRLYGTSSRQDYLPPRAKHLLVTGAGFEIRNPLGGFGMPLTPVLLERMGPPFRLIGEKDGPGVQEAEVLLRRQSRGLPVPVGDRWKNIRSIQDAAKEEELDLYWDILLAGELAHNLGELLRMESEQRERVSDQALFAERQMREAFRRSIQDHDWGHMNQSLIAAQLPWHAWLTTNYTRFADRAISLMAPAPPQAWRVIATAAEANASIREDAWLLENPGADVSRYRYLFKLHGDVGHLQTMAIAGHDKAPFSLLSTPIDDIYQVYSSAERFLGYSLRNSTVPIVWHIVGHAMKDRRLVSLIGLMCERIKSEHIFLIADPRPEAALHNIEGELRSRDIKYMLFTKKLLAENYLARLEPLGLPLHSECQKLVSWFESLPG